MKTFYIFKLNKNYQKEANSKPFNIYALLNSIYTYNKSDINVALNLFKEICLPINKEFYNTYFYNKFKSKEEYTKFQNIHMYYNYMSGETSKMIVNNCYILIKSNSNKNIFILNLLEDLFICEFKNTYYTYNKCKIR